MNKIKKLALFFLDTIFVGLAFSGMSSAETVTITSERTTYHCCVLGIVDRVNGLPTSVSTSSAGNGITAASDYCAGLTGHACSENIEFWNKNGTNYEMLTHCVIEGSVQTATCLSKYRTCANYSCTTYVNCDPLGSSVYLAEKLKQLGVIDPGDTTTTQPLSSSGSTSSGGTGTTGTTGGAGTAAPDSPEASTGYSSYNKLASTSSSKDSIINVLKWVVNILSGAVLVVAVIMLIIGAIQYSASGGDPNGVKAAKSKITNVLIGIVAYVFLYSFLQWLIPGGIFQ